MSFRDSFKSNSIENLSKEMEKIKNPKSYKDDRFWRPKIDPAGNGYAIVRFLPPSEGEDVPWASVYTHAFRGPGGWYIENCLTTLNKPDPVIESNNLLYNSGIESDKDIARPRNRKLTYTSNILVVHDPESPENDGKVFLFRYGKKIFEKINEAMNPAFADEIAINPFDFWKGADFKLKIRKVEGYTNYDKSSFEPQSVLFDGDDSRIEQLWKTQYPLAPFIDESNFKSYDDLSARFKMVTRTSMPSENAESYSESRPESLPVSVSVDDSPPFADNVTSTTSTSNTTDAEDYFEKLANED